LPSKPTHEARARRYLQASMHAGYTGLPPEHREAYEQQMRAHERAYSRVREHALAGADRDFDQPLTPGEREHQRHLRTHEGLQEHDVHRIRGELRNPRGQERHVASRSRRRGAGAGAGPRAAAAAAGAAGGAIPGIGGNTGMYLLGVGLLLCLLYLLIYGKGAHAITGIVNTLVGGVDAFVRPIDPLAKLETALGATSIAAQAAVGIPEGPVISRAGTKAEEAEVDQISKQKGWSALAWDAVIERESGWNPNAVNSSSGAYGIGQFLGATKEEYAAEGATSTNPLKQIQAMGDYIANRYGNPSNALAHELQYHWY
jgi:hypothetical protein